MNDRAAQACQIGFRTRMGAQFEPNSYGFDQDEQTHDAFEAIFNAIRYKAKYVLDDIAKCFDRIDHEALLNKLKHPQQYVAK